MGDDLGIAMRGEGVSAAAQLLAQLAVVVDLAIEDNCDGAVLVVNGLVAGLQVDDSQPLDP